MQLSRHTDLALRLLIQLASEPKAQMTIARVAQDQAVPQHYLMKIANALAHAGFITATRGRGGGVALARPAKEIRIGTVVRAMEPQSRIVDCSDCLLAPNCRLPRHLGRAMNAFYDVLDEQTLEDVV